MKTKKYVFCFIFDELGRVLVLKRANFMRARPAEWDIPGGSLDEGEDYEQGMIREVFEETGLTINSPELIVRKGGLWLGGMHEFSYYRANAESTSVHLSEEHSGFEWHEPMIAGTILRFRPHLYGLHKLSNA